MLRIFLSAGEPSGDLHGSNLAVALHQLQPDLQCVGFGGERMAAAGCDLLFPLSQLAVVGFARVLSNLRSFLRLLDLADRFFRDQRPDAVILIDFPGFHWLLAQTGAQARHPGVLLCAAPAVGLGGLARPQDVPLGRSCLV